MSAKIAFSPTSRRLCVLVQGLFILSATEQFLPAQPYLDYNGRSASAPSTLPTPIRKAVDAANRLQGKPYKWGGGHKSLYDRGYDCSGSVSHVLYKAGLIRGPMTSKQFYSYGSRGPGKYITIFMHDGHVFMSVCGLRFDTSDHGAGRGDGPRWRPTSRSFAGYQMRHPRGL